MSFSFHVCLGHVGISARHSNHFRVSVNTAAKSTVIFHLLYEELLQRKQGMYDHVINLTPRQKLKHFSIDVSFDKNNKHDKFFEKILKVL